MAITNMGAVYGHKYARNLLLDGFADDPTDKLSNFQRQKIDYLFHVLYALFSPWLKLCLSSNVFDYCPPTELQEDISNDKTISRQDFFQLSQKLKELRGWEDGKELRQAQTIINHMWTCLLRGNRKYRTNQLQIHMRRSEWRRYWGDFIEASLAKGGWPDKCLDNVVDYGWQQEYMRFMFILMDTNGDWKIDRDEYIKCFTSFGVPVEHCVRAYDIFSSSSQNADRSIDYKLFEQLWFQYLTSNNPEDPGNYLMGKIYFE